MFDIGWPEMALVAVIALIIIGPKDLPRILRYAGRWAGKARRMAREFQRNFDDMVRESDLGEIKKSVDQVGAFNAVKDIGNSIDPTGEMKKDIESLTKDAGETASDAPQSDAPQSDAPQSDAPQSEAPQSDVPETESPRADSPDSDTPQSRASG